ncbi:phage tail protein
MGAAKRKADRTGFFGLLTNNTNAYTLTYDVPPVDYFRGEPFSFFVNATNTGPVTLSINGMPAEDLVQGDGTALKAGDLVAELPVMVTYNGSKFRMVTASANPSFGAISATTVAATTGMTVNSLPVFTTANDGTGSGLDSDKLDGQEGVWYQSRANHTGTQDVATITGLQAVLDAIVPTASVIYVASAAAPTGYLAANGTAVSRTTYARLFTTIGTTFGAGDGSTTFNLPDLRGEFIVSATNGPRLS